MSELKSRKVEEELAKECVKILEKRTKETTRGNVLMTLKEFKTLLSSIPDEDGAGEIEVSVDLIYEYSETYKDMEMVLNSMKFVNLFERELQDNESDSIV